MPLLHDRNVKGTPMEPRTRRVVVALLDVGFALFARVTKGDAF
jgi:hypothetical protein